MQIDSVSPTGAFNDGGYRITLTGVFPANERLRVYLGTKGNDTDPVLYSGVPGQGSDVYPIGTTKVVAFVPLIEAGGPYVLTVAAPDLAQSVSLVDAVTIHKRQLHSRVFNLRRMFPPQWLVGPRTPDQLEPVA